MKTARLLIFAVLDCAASWSQNLSIADRGLQPLQHEAEEYVMNQTACISASAHFPQVPKELFTNQLIERIKSPYGIQQGRSLFCWSAIPIAYLFEAEPLEISKAAIHLFKPGEFLLTINQKTIHFPVSTSAKSAVGTSSFCGHMDGLKGGLLDQMLFLAFADHYKCWLNLDHRYQRGDQINPLWAGATLAKEELIWRYLGFTVTTLGHNIRWLKRDKVKQLRQTLVQSRVTVLYINQATIKRTWRRIGGLKIIPPIRICASHYVLLKSIKSSDDGYSLTAWDQDGWMDYTFSEEHFDRALFGFVAVK